MNAQQMFKPNGDGFDVSPAGVLLMAAWTLYGDPSESTPEGMRTARVMVDGILAAAAAGGYMQCDMLRALLKRKQATPRLMAMAQAACDAAGEAAIHNVFTKVQL